MSPPLKDISMTTNGILLEDMLHDLKSAGLQRINISLDALDADTFKKITGADSFDAVWSSIIKAVSIGFKRIKLNTVLLKGVNDKSILEFAEITRRHAIDVRFIEYMGSVFQYVPRREALQRLKEHYSIETVANYPFEGGGPAEYMRIHGAKGFLGLISPNTHNFCSKCTRIRLTADGRLFPCLFSPRHIDMVGMPNISGFSTMKAGIKRKGETITFCGG